MKENNEIEDIVFDCLYYSPNINKYSKNDLTTLITLRLLQYIFVFNLDNFDNQELLYLLNDYNYIDLINIKQWLNLLQFSLTIFYNCINHMDNYIDKIIINMEVFDKLY